MIETEDQGPVRAFLDDETSAAGAPARRESHISELWLGPERVLKLKRAVKLPYLDFSSAGRRLAACRHELERNRVAAPDLYLGVRRITETADALEWDGSGPLRDAVLEMRRFDEAGLLDRLAASGHLEVAEMEPLADAVAALHAAADVSREDGAANLAAVLEINRQGFATSEVFAPDRLAAFDSACRDALAAQRDLLAQRGQEGSVRLCHGDLHLGNIVMIGNRPVLFDCIEFDDRMATVDVLYDLAFLLMDLRHRGLSGHAALLANRYLDATGDEAGMTLLPLFMAVRAAVRAHVTGTQIAEAHAPPGAEESALSYLAEAERLLRPPPPVVVAIGGLSGSGKSTLADALAPDLGGAPGARHLASDRIRKARYGVAPRVGLPAEAYAPEVSMAVYRELVHRSRALASDGVAVIADAVFARPEERAAIAGAAQAAGCAFVGIWLDGAAVTLRDRVAARYDDPSDATPEVVTRQLDYDLGVIEWTRIDAGRPFDMVCAAALAEIARVTGQPTT